MGRAEMNKTLPSPARVHPSGLGPGAASSRKSALISSEGSPGPWAPLHASSLRASFSRSLWPGGASVPSSWNAVGARQVCDEHPSLLGLLLLSAHPLLSTAGLLIPLMEWKLPRHGFQPGAMVSTAGIHPCPGKEGTGPALPSSLPEAASSSPGSMFVFRFLRPASPPVCPLALSCLHILPSLLDQAGRPLGHQARPPRPAPHPLGPEPGALPTPPDTAWKSPRVCSSGRSTGSQEPRLVTRTRYPQHIYI